jgi:glucosamine--fructose-6-phosphate aminotransferase (isomerizing)
MYLQNDDIAIVTPDKVEVFDSHNKRVERPTKNVNPQDLSIGKNGYDSFMLKEIYEQPATIADTLNAYMTGNHKNLKLPDLGFSLADIDSIRIIACGTSYHAAMVAKYWLEFFARVPVTVDIASEFRYRQPPLTPHGLSIFISQSGETADTIAALELAKEAGQKILSIVNVPESTIDRESHASLYTKAGAEIGVASTKAFTSQLLVLATLAVEIAEAKGQYTPDQAHTRLQQLIELPNHVTTMLELDAQVKLLAQELVEAASALFIGRGVLYPIALEGALKLKEISYIHAEGLAAGELKHGSIALIDENMPVICLAPMNELFEKTLSNLKEVQARKGKVIVFTDPEGAAEMRGHFDRLVIMPKVPAFTQPLVYTIPLQLLAYHTATLRGCDVDKPRNLAKSVTVE